MLLSFSFAVMLGFLYQNCSGLACSGSGHKTKVLASSGNRTRAARVAGEHSTTEPTMLSWDIVDWEKISKTLLTFAVFTMSK